MVAAGAFREDLYFRLAVLPAAVPPLRARPDDIALLLEHFLAGRAPVPHALTSELAAYPWVGNVRELRTFAERVVVMGAEAAWSSMQGVDTGASVPPAPPAPRHSGDEDELPPARISVPFKELRETWLDHLERDYFSQLIEVHSRNVTAIAEAAGLDRSYVHRILRKHEL